MLPTPTAGPIDPTVLAFESAATGHPIVNGALNPGRIAQEFVVELATHLADDPTFCLQWTALVTAGPSHQKIYQTPEYFYFRRDSCGPRELFELVAIKRRADGTLAGIVPVRIGFEEVVFCISKVSLLTTEVEMISLLGSMAAGPGGAAMAHYLMRELLTLFPKTKAVIMHALPRHSELWSALTAEDAHGRRFGIALMGPWRGCHTLPLPATFAQYMDKFSAKKRYNLNRQIRQLRDQAGELELLRLERPEQIPQLMTMLRALLSQGQLSHLLRETTYTALARKGLLLAYVLRSGDTVLAVVMATRSPDVVHVHNIFVTSKHQSLSVGTSVMHLAIQDVLNCGGFRMIDFGYGTPNEEFRSSHVIEDRAQVLVFNRRQPVSLLFACHSLFTRTVEGAIAGVKKVLKLWRKGRASKL